MPALVECVPNFSEGRDRSVIDAISRAISGVSGVRLLDVDAGADTNRTVYTFRGRARRGERGGIPGRGRGRASSSTCRSTRAPTRAWARSTSARSFRSPA